MEILDINKIYVLICRRKFRFFDYKCYVGIIIRLWQKFPAEHVSFMFFENNRWMVAEATTGKVKITPADNWIQFSNWYAFVFESVYDQYQKNKMIEYAFECEGKVKYDFLGLIWMAVYIKKKIWLGRKSNQHQRQFCSEFYFNAKGIEGAQYKSIKDAYLSATHNLGCLANIEREKAFIVSKYLPTWQ